MNALAGSGTLLSFPVLTAIGVPALAANITNAVAMCPGYLGATLAQPGPARAAIAFVAHAAGRRDPAAGGVLLLNTGERAFRSAVPFLILFASALCSSGSGARLAHAACGVSLTLGSDRGGAGQHRGHLRWVFRRQSRVIVLAFLRLLIGDS